MSPVCFVSIINFLMSPAIDTANDGAGGVFLFFVFSKYFQISGLISV